MLHLTDFIIEGDEDSVERLLRDPTLDVNTCSSSWFTYPGSPFEDCYRFRRQYGIARIISNHSTFDPNMPCIHYGSFDRPIDPLHFLVIMANCSDDEQEFRELLLEAPERLDRDELPFLDLLLSHPRLRKETVQNGVNAAQSDSTKNYLLLNWQHPDYM